MKDPFVIDVRPVRSEKLTAQEYLKMQSENPALIERAQFIPPWPGERGFGSFNVRYTRARYRSLAHG